MTTEVLKRITRDDTEHGVEYYRADQVDALLAEQPAPQPEQQEAVSDAGIKIWIGNKQVVQKLTQTQLHHARDPWMLVELTADKCIAALKEKVND